MIYGLIVLLATTALSFGLINYFQRKFPLSKLGFLRTLLFYHLLLAAVYFIYAAFNPSDSHHYHFKLAQQIHGDSWLDYYGTSTAFIEFLGYPFVTYFGFTYEAMMALFQFVGFCGFIYFYILFKENIKFRHTLFGFDLITILFYLPNLHFWSSSFGKGSVVFLGIGMLFYGLSSIRKRWLIMFVGALIIYHVRPHILLVILVSSIIGFVFSTRGISPAIRVMFLIGASIAFYFIYESVLTLVGIDENEFVSQGLNLSGRARELTKSTSGVDIASYSLPMQLFTFVYRPLFVDGLGALGFIVSFENLFYLFVTIRMFTPDGIRFLLFSNFLVKTAFLSFLTVSIALAQVSGNLGLAIRQKSQVMLLFMFVIVAYEESKKQRASVKRRPRQTKMPVKPVANLG